MNYCIVYNTQARFLTHKSNVKVSIHCFNLKISTELHNNVPVPYWGKKVKKKEEYTHFSYC